MDTRRAVVVQLSNRQGQLDGKSCAHTFALACGPDRTAMQLHELLADRQPQPEATVAPGSRAVFLRESVEHVRKIIGRNADAGIADAQFEVRIHPLEQYLYLASL